MTKPKYEPYFPFGFQYPDGFTHSDAFPDPKIEAIKKRMEYLNKLHSKTDIPGHLFAAALALFQKESLYPTDKFWDHVQTTFSAQEVIEIVQALLPQVVNEPPRLEFPNAIALVDCRFVSTSEWEHFRRYSIGGSEASTVLGKSHFQSRRTLYHEKKTPYTDNKDIGFQHILDYGHAVEDFIVAEAARRIGAVIYPEYRMFAHRKYRFITCNPDGILLFLDGHLALFEAKTAFWKKYKDWKEGIPDYYEPQPRQYMEVLDDSRLTEGFIAVCIGGLEKDFLLHTYQRDSEKGAAQIQEVVQYWQDYIVPGVLPDFSGNPELDLEAQYKYIPHNIAGIATDVLPQDALPLFHRYFDLQAEKKTVDAEIKEAKAKCEAMLADITGDLPDGMTVVTIPTELLRYKIKIQDAAKDSVVLQKLISRSTDAERDLSKLAEKLKETSTGWSVPKVSKMALQGK